MLPGKRKAMADSIGLATTPLQARDLKYGKQETVNGVFGDGRWGTEGSLSILKLLLFVPERLLEGTGIGTGQMMFTA